MGIGASWAFDFEIVAVKPVKLAQGLDNHEVDGEPYGSAPVGIPAEMIALRFAGLVGHGERGSVVVENVGGFEMAAGQGADAVVRKKLVFVEHEL